MLIRQKAQRYYGTPQAAYWLSIQLRRLASLINAITLLIALLSLIVAWLSNVNETGSRGDWLGLISNT